MKTIICVYQIRNLINGDRYIGSTKNYKARIRAHLNTLRKGIHASKSMQNAFDSQGEKVFVFEIVEMARTRNLLACEQRYLDQHPTYNSAMIAGPGRRGMKNSYEHRARISHSLIGRISPLKGKILTQKHKDRLSVSVGKTKHVRWHVRKGLWSIDCELCARSLKEYSKLKCLTLTTAERKRFRKSCETSEYIQKSMRAA
jgi:group I intron endonuclease